MEVIRIALDSITVSPEVQPRHLGLDESHVDDMTEWLDRHPDKDLPPARVFKTPAGYVLSRGFHRHAAYTASSRSVMPCEVVEGTFEDAVRDAASSAAEHQSLKFTTKDKRRAVANVLRVSPQWNDKMVADHVGVVTDKTVADVRRELEAVSEIPKLAERVGRDGKTYPATRARQQSEPVGQPNGTQPGELDEFTTPSFDIPDDDGGESVSEFPKLDGDAPADPDAFYKSKDSFADDLAGALRKLGAVRAAVSAVFESPHRADAVTASRRGDLLWSPSGDEAELANRLGVRVVMQLWTCDELDRLSRYLNELRSALLRADVADRPAAWEAEG